MKAETVFNVIEALDKKERPRLFKMLGVQYQKTKRKSFFLSDAEIKEKLMKYLK